ncbi:condensation domain-containing protein, partial [Nocardiopsis alba]|uniref:condensation domain-containing protein n=1 Tax=Nocardiopsis alba TaxID=53437 RepID=UPI0033EF4A28
LAAFDHQDTPFDLVVEELAPERSTSHHPLFQVTVALNPAFEGASEFAGTESPEVVSVSTGVAKFDLAVAFTERRGEDGAPAGLSGLVEYAVDLFDADTVRALVAVLERTLRSVAEDASVAVGDVVRLSARERSALTTRDLPERLPKEVEEPAPGLPRTPRQEILCGLFAELLGRGSVEPGENFFRSGGNSLLALRLVSRVRSVLKAEVGLRDFFRDPTVAGVDRLVAESGGVPARPGLVPVDRGERSPLSYAQRRLWFLDRLEGASANYNVSVALRLRGAVDVPALRASLLDVVDRHEALRTLFVEHEGEPFQRVLGTGEARERLSFEAYECAETLIASTISEFTAGTFDLARDLPARARLLRVSDEEAVLVVLTHHIATDGWSEGVLLRDLAEAYGARRVGRVPG